MKSIDKVISDRKVKIEINNLSVIDYFSHKKIKCICNICKYEIIDNHRNLSYKNYLCKYCELKEISEIIKTGESEIIEIKSKNILLKCKKGHLYTQLRGNLLSGKKCKTCYIENKSYTKGEIILEFNKIHGNYYDYDLCSYKNLHTKIKIKCKKGHEFYQKVSNHLQGKGCPVCRESLGERRITKFLEENKIPYTRQKKFDNCKYITYLPFDFFVPELNLLIEYDGIQHEKPIKQFGGEREFEKTKMKDQIKNKFCVENNINLLRINYKEDILEKLNTIEKYIVF